jgi:uronate dehydrogenase
MGKPGPILLTGAAGKLGGRLRPHLSARPAGLRSSDIREFAPALAGEEIALADLFNGAEVDRLVAGARAIIHFGAVGVEDSSERILKSNIVETKNIFDAGFRHAVKRIVFASSIHVIGFYPTSQVVDAEAPPRPDLNFHQGLAVHAVCDAIERAAAERRWVKLEEIVTP